MASRTGIFSLTALLLSTQFTPAASEKPAVVSILDYGNGYGHQVDSLTFSEGGYGYGPQPSAEPTPSGDGYGYGQSSAEPTPSNNGYGYGPESSTESTPSDNGYGYGPQTSVEPTSSEPGYQNPTEPATSLPSISTPGPTAPYSSYGSISSSWSQNCTKETTITVTIPSPTPSPSTSHTCHNTTTSAIYTPISTSLVSTSRNCTTKSTTTVTIPWPGTGTGQPPSASGTGGYGQAPYGNGTYYSPSVPGSAPPSATGIVSTWTSSSELGSETDSATLPPDVVESTPTPTLPPAQSSPVVEPSGNTPPAPPASPTTSGEPLFTGGAIKRRNGAGLAVAVGALMVLL